MLPTRPPVSATRHLLLCWHLGSVLATALSPLVIALLHAQLAVGERVVEGLLPAATSRSFEAAVLDDVRRLRSNDAQKCLVWNRLTPSDLCELTPWKRLKRMRSVLLFQQDCREETNVQLWELFLLGTREWSAESDLYVTANLAHLRNDSGRDCVQAEAGSQRCLRCFGLVDELMDAVHRYYVNFNRTLSRFDCSMLGWTDRRFSPNATCDHCKAWYRKWLLVNLGKLYTFEPCKTWCDYAQLACPHLTATKAGDYAGHPSFQCTDTDFPLPVGKTSTPECDCVHPCDLQATLGDGADYFATKLHCQRRRRTCSHAPPSVPAADRSSANARARCWGGWSLSRLVWLLSVAWWWTTAIGR